MNLPVDSINLQPYSTAELIRLRNRITELLPSTELESLNLGQELVSVFQKAKALLDEADDETALSQKAATVNSIVTSLKVLKDMQDNLYSIQNQQKLETALIEALKAFPEVQAKFFDVYETLLSS